MAERVFNFDPMTRVTTYFVPTEDGEGFRLEQRQDVEPILERAEVVRKEFDARAPWKGNIHHVASIPAIVWADLRRKGIAQDENALRAWLNQSDNDCFRMRKGRV